MMPHSIKKPVIFLAVILSCPILLLAQGNPEIGIFGGVSSYNGDLESRRIALDQMHPAGGLFIQKEIYKHFGVRLGVTFGKISGADSLSSKDYMKARNLSFQSNITDFHLLLKYDFAKVEQATGGFLPYVYAGVSVFNFNPYAKDSAGRKIYLQPLSTEGEGLSGYPNRKPYQLTQFAIPFGAGVRYPLTEGIYLGFEFQVNKTFTDYLDDVSTTYVDQNALLQQRGPSAVYFAYRANELPGHTTQPYPAEGSQRGSPKVKDWYYFVGLTLTVRLNASGGHNGLRQLRCPVPMKK